MPLLERAHYIRRHSYHSVFAGPAAKIVLNDMARFCHAQKTTHVEGDPCGTAQLEGRRQVWLRVQEYLRLTESDLNSIAEYAELTEGGEP